MERLFGGIIDKINALAFIPFIRMKALVHPLFPFFPCASVGLSAALTVGVFARRAGTKGRAKEE